MPRVELDSIRSVISALRAVELDANMWRRPLHVTESLVARDVVLKVAASALATHYRTALQSAAVAHALSLAAVLVIATPQPEKKLIGIAGGASGRVMGRFPPSEGSPEYALHSAAKLGQLDSIKRLTQRGVDVHAENSEDRTAVHMSAGRGHVSCLAWLVAQGARVDCEDEDGFTPLHLACRSGHVECAQWLIDHGADVLCEDYDQRTPLHAASSRGQLESVKLLTRKGARMDAADHRGTTPLHLASHHGHAKCVELLLREGAVWHVHDVRNTTPLHRAVTRRRASCVAALLSFGVEFYKRTESKAMGNTSSVIQAWHSGVSSLQRTYTVTHDMLLQRLVPHDLIRLLLSHAFPPHAWLVEA